MIVKACVRLVYFILWVLAVIVAPAAPVVPLPASCWGAEVDGEIRYDLHDGQADILSHPARFKAAVAGTGGGKTAIGPLWIMQQINRVLSDPTRDVARDPILGMVIAPTHDVMSRATAPTMVRMLVGTDLEGRYVETRKRYYLPGNIGTIWTLSADSPGGLEGGQFDFVWMDEAGQMKYDAWVAVQGRTGQKQAPVLITTTPYGQNWLYSKFFRLAAVGDSNYYVRQWSSVANPSYPQDEYERAKREMSGQRFAMRYDGNFVKLAGLVYPELESCVCDFTSPPPGLHYGGLDWGFSIDPFAAHAAVLDEEDVLWIWYERYVRGKLIGEHATKLPRNVEYFADSSRPDLIGELNAAGHIVRSNKVKSIEVGIDAVSRRIYRGTLKIHPRCLALRGEAREYQYPSKDDELLSVEPVGPNHALDDIRYMIANIDRHAIAEAA